MKSDIVEAFSQIAKEKNIEREVLGEILESKILSIIRKKYGKAAFQKMAAEGKKAPEMKVPNGNQG